MEILPYGKLLFEAVSANLTLFLHLSRCLCVLPAYLLAYGVVVAVRKTISTPGTKEESCFVSTPKNVLRLIVVQNSEEESVLATSKEQCHPSLGYRVKPQEQQLLNVCLNSALKFLPFNIPA